MVGIGRFHRRRSVKHGGLRSGLGGIARTIRRTVALTVGIARLGAGLRTRLGPGLAVIGLRVLFLLGDAPRRTDTQHRAEVHLRGRTDEVQLLLGGGTGNRYHDVRITHGGNLGFRHAGGVDSVTDNRDRLRDVLIGDLTLSVTRHGRSKDQLGSALQIEGQVGIRGYVLREVPDRQCRARRHDGDGERHERAHGTSLV